MYVTFASIIMLLLYYGQRRAAQIQHDRLLIIVMTNYLVKPQMFLHFDQTNTRTAL